MQKCAPGYDYRSDVLTRWCRAETDRASLAYSYTHRNSHLSYSVTLQ